MKRDRFILTLTLVATVCASVRAQERNSNITAPDHSFSLEPAFPNPFEKQTRIPFLLQKELFENRDSVIVSVHIYNLLHQLIAIPVLVQGDGEVRRLDALIIPSVGRYEAVWDGRNLKGGRVTEGPYFIQLLVDGQSQVRKVFYVR